MATRLTIGSIADWPTANYADPLKRPPTLTAVNAFFFSLMTVVLALRLYSKAAIKKSLGIDDVLICFSWIFTFGMHSVTTIGTEKYGWNRHTWDVPYSWVQPSYQLVYAGQLLFLLAANCTACSMLAFYFRLRRDSSIRWFNWALGIAVAINWLGWIPFFLLHCFPCRPVKAFWTFPPMYASPCINFKAATFGGGVYKLFIDVMITTLPIPLILGLKLNSAQKYGVVVALALGYVVCAAGAVRTYYTYIIFFKTTDVVWYEYPAFLALTVENDLGVICACLPFLRPLLGKHVERLFTLMRSTLRTSDRGLDGKTMLESSSTPYQNQHSNTGSSHLTTCRTELSTFIFDDIDEDIEHSHPK